MSKDVFNSKTVVGNYIMQFNQQIIYTINRRTINQRPFRLEL
jgi:hypothetical protein